MRILRMATKNLHKPVLLKEAIDILDLEEGDVYLDATLGMGGHAEEVWKRLGNRVEILGIDADSEAVAIAEERLALDGAKPKFATLNFKNLDRVEELLRERPNKILFDLGWNRRQFDSPAGAGRGFSFQKDEPLFMTFSQDPNEARFTAYDIVNFWEQENLETIIRAYGEERFAGRIARRIVEARGEKTIKTSRELAEIVKKAVPLWYRFKKIHPATRTFQGLRIAVNDELKALEEGLDKGFEILKKGGRMVVISFHSLEDRIVKNFYKQKAEAGEAEILTKKPIIPTEEEIRENPRSRSAKLRALKK